MNPRIERIEVYVDEGKEPIKVLTEPPFKVELDTRTLPDGEHELKVVTVFKDGSREVHTLPFIVDNLPDAFVDGIDEGQRVRGKVEFDVLVGDYDKPIGPAGASPWLYILATVLVLSLVWVFFAASSTAAKMAGKLAEQPQAAAAAHGGGEAAAPAAEVDQELLALGEKVYQDNCAACHMADGAGMPPTFPALKDNPNLKDTKLVVETIVNGRGAMPPFGQLSDKEVAAVATYIRVKFNNFGPVSEEEVKQYR